MKHCRAQPWAILMEPLEPRLLLSYDYVLSHVSGMHVARGHDVYVSLRASRQEDQQDTGGRRWEAGGDRGQGRSYPGRGSV